MYDITLVGKKYLDLNATVEDVVVGETNSCSFVSSDGSSANFLKALDPLSNFLINVHHVGTKQALIINNTKASARTSFVSDLEYGSLTKETLACIDNKSEWVHVMYLDDLNGWEILADISASLSVDFCTTKPRENYLNVLRAATVVFDSRERKELYNNLKITAPIIFHDERGVEVQHFGQKVFSEDMIPLSGLNVNGAGDMFASYFLQNYKLQGIEKAAVTAMRETTNLLILRNKQ